MILRRHMLKRRLISAVLASEGRNFRTILTPAIGRF